MYRQVGHTAGLSCMIQKRTLEQLQQEHAELLEFNETLDKKYKHHSARAEKYRRKCESIASLFVVPSENHQMTIKAIQTILERVGDQ